MKKFQYIHSLQEKLMQDYCDRLGGIIVDSIDETEQELSDEKYAAYRELAKRMLMDSFGNTAQIVFNEIQVETEGTEKN